MLSTIVVATTSVVSAGAGADPSCTTASDNKLIFQKNDLYVINREKKTIARFFSFLNVLSTPFMILLMDAQDTNAIPDTFLNQEEILLDSLMKRLTNLRSRSLQHLLRILNIAQAIVIYFCFSVFAMNIFNSFVYGNDFSLENETKKSTERLVLDVILNAWLTAIALYVARTVYTFIPFPFEGAGGYKQKDASEIVSGSAFSLFMSYFNTRFRKQVGILVDRLGFNITD